MTTEPSIPTLSTASATFVLYEYNWNHSHDSERISIRSFPTQRDAEEAYSGNQDSAEVALVRGGEIRVISRGAVNRNGNSRQIHWQREALLP